jgi:hypothetical protein
MKLVRFGDRRAGLVVDLKAGPHIIDVVASVGALLPDDPISNGVLNGILKDAGSWAPLIEHWPRASAGLRRLITLALKAPDHPRLVLRSYDDAKVALHDSGGIVAIEISEPRERQPWDPTGRASMTTQFEIALAPSVASDLSGENFGHAHDDKVVIAFARPTGPMARSANSD